jgi:hypothetical protein
MTEEEALAFVEGDTRKTLLRGVEELFAVSDEFEDKPVDEFEDEPVDKEPVIVERKKPIYPAVS